MTLTVIDYGSGNIRSVAKALEAASSRTVRVTADPRHIAQASHLIVPGQGAFGQCRAGLLAIDGLMAALQQAVCHFQVPYLGICVGMQLMLERGLENGIHLGFGWMKGEVAPIPPGPAIKIPHMGWNQISVERKHSVLDPLNGKDVYFCHSYGARKVSTPLAMVTYGTPQVAAIGQENMIGVQFHPEKSQKVGLDLLTQFARWMP